ncbi:MAG: SHOCT domain-containing protein [Chloroflexi bacterium]|nr:MAG: SHOCT domain-containing protein [Chloroflexota bacterium]
MGFHHFQNPPGDQLGWLHGLFTLLVVAAIVAGVVLIARQWRRPAHPPAAGWSPQSPGIHELDVRYARGEIDRADYLQRRADILGAAAAPSLPAAPDAPPS